MAVFMVWRQSGVVSYNRDNVAHKNWNIYYRYLVICKITSSTPGPVAPKWPGGRGVVFICSPEYSAYLKALNCGGSYVEC